MNSADGQMTNNREVELFGVKLTRNAQPVLLKDSTTSRPQGRNGDKPSKWIATGSPHRHWSNRDRKRWLLDKPLKQH